MNLFVTFLWNDSITLNSPFTNFITYTVFVSSEKLVSRDLMFSSRPFIKCNNYHRTRKRAFRVSLEKTPDHWRFSVCIYSLKINLFAITIFNICNIDILFFSTSLIKMPEGTKWNILQELNCIAFILIWWPDVNVSVEATYVGELCLQILPIWAVWTFIWKLLIIKGFPCEFFSCSG